MAKGPTIKKVSGREYALRLAEAHERAAWGTASLLSSTQDPELRVIYEKRLARDREQAAHYRAIANDDPEPGQL